MDDAFDRAPEPTTQPADPDTAEHGATAEPMPEITRRVRDVPPAVEVEGPILTDPDARSGSVDPLDPHAPSRETRDPLDPDGHVS